MEIILIGLKDKNCDESSIIKFLRAKRSFRLARAELSPSWTNKSPSTSPRKLKIHILIVTNQPKYIRD